MIFSARALPLIILAAPVCLFAQTDASATAVRVSVLLNPDGSRTVYEADNANHKSVATTTGQDGKVREKIRYDLDESGRFAAKSTGRRSNFVFLPSTVTMRTII